MTKSIFIAAALIATAAFATDASAATRHIATRHAEASAMTDSFAGGCVRAPDVGAFATAPYKAPPCLPGTAAY
ncbi:hypothetical protein JQ633_30140 [Bradyrhizobium tropiciagri]|uniref:hypothetical protein n=1 Tax=Bradyrhizobium tropiciagri TaxID=312253 RepID=UPI001BA8B9D6|nr:hypothetical protein [Bradyrhizobium tropiciagri]MBR0874653.1 hypothetical protein [Bradyrhizobium tropiciagri]